MDHVLFLEQDESSCSDMSGHIWMEGITSINIPWKSLSFIRKAISVWTVKKPSKSANFTVQVGEVPQVADFTWKSNLHGTDRNRLVSSYNLQVDQSAIRSTLHGLLSGMWLWKFTFKIQVGWIRNIPKPSMYGIFTYSWLIFMVGKYTIHGWQGIVTFTTMHQKTISPH